MIDSDKTGFKTLLTAAYKIYNVKVDTPTLKIWWSCLKKYSAEDVQQAFSQHLQTNKWSPRPAEIIEILELAKANTLAHKKVILLHHKHTAEERAANLARLKDITSELFKGVK